MYRRWMITAFVLLAGAGLVIACAGAQVADSGIAIGETAAAASTLESAQTLAAKGRLDQAMVVLDQLAAQTPVQPGVERLRGIIYYQKNELAQAVVAFGKAMAQDAGDRESTQMEGVSLFRLGRPGEAIPYLEKAHMAVERANIDPQYVLGLCYADVSRYDDARKAFAAQYGFEPESAEAYLLAGRLFLRRELRDQATVQAKKALEINPSLPLAHELLGEAELARGDVAAAIRDLEAERKLNPLDGDLYDRLGDAYLRDGDYANAQKSLNRAVLLEPSATGPYILLGQTFLKLKEPIQALHYLDHAVKMDPNNYVTHNLLGQAYKATGQMAEANRQFQMVVEIQRRDDPKPAGK